MEKILKVYKVKFNEFGTIHVVASSYKNAATTYERWVEDEFPDAKDWTTKSITELQSSKPTLIAT